MGSTAADIIVDVAENGGRMEADERAKVAKLFLPLTKNTDHLNGCGSWWKLHWLSKEECRDL
jgi:hypothetical protein